MTFLNTHNYSELRQIATRMMRKEHKNRFIESDDLLQEALMRLFVSSQPVLCVDAGHFKAIASRVMRWVLIDQSRRLGAMKRPESLPCVPIESTAVQTTDSSFETFLIMDQLRDLWNERPRQGAAIYLRVFEQAPIEEIARRLATSERTVKRELGAARARFYPGYSAKRARVRSARRRQKLMTARP